VADAVQQAFDALVAEKRSLRERLTQVDAAMTALKPLLSSARRAAKRDDRMNGAASGSTPTSWSRVTEDVLQEAGGPLHVQEIIRRLKAKGYAIDPDRAGRSLIAGIIGRKARSGEVFEHVAPGTFGLKALQAPRNVIEKATELFLEGWGSDAQTEVGTGASQTAALTMIVMRHPNGITPSEVVDIMERELGEPPEVARARRNSRMTRLLQLANSKRIVKREGILFPS
jgi:hypothetical protein